MQCSYNVEYSDDGSSYILNPKPLIFTGLAGSFNMVKERRTDVPGTASVSSLARGAYRVSGPASSVVMENLGGVGFVSGFLGSKGRECEHAHRASTAALRMYTFVPCSVFMVLDPM